MFDRPDLVHHLYCQLTGQGYSGCPISHVYRDEVQDFVQGELLLDLLLLGKPPVCGNVFYCGDTAQTIARGVGFRFTDVKVMLQDAAAARPAAEQAKVGGVGVIREG